MTPADAVPDWVDRLADTLRRYEEPLIRKVAARLARPRNQWPADELVNRCVEVVNNPPVLDRRIADLAEPSRRLLALIGHSRQPTWAMGSLVELMMALGQADGLGPVMDLLEAGLLYPVLGPPPTGNGRRGRFVSFDHWLGMAGAAGMVVFSPPQIADRARGIDLGLPDLSANIADISGPLSPVEGDGLEWPLRLGVLWQQVAAAPLRRTQGGGLFKRDIERLEADPLLTAPPADAQADVPDLGFLAAELAERLGVVGESDGEIRAADLPATWDAGLWPALEAIFAQLFRLRGWGPLDGWRTGELPLGNPFPSAYLLALLLLGRAPAEAWVRPADIDEWLLAAHPYWVGENVRPSLRRPWAATFLLGVCYQLRLVQAAAAGEERLVRLSPLGRGLLGLADIPGPPTVFPRTLLVQPNLEMIAYRQGLTPALVARLTKFAQWKTLGAACTLQLGPETVYRALERGETFDSIVRALDQHGTRATPPGVIDSLRTWSNKRDRITVFPAAALLEFNSAAELEEALARGLPAIRVGEAVAVVASEDQIEFAHYRLTGTRDYALPPERCVGVESDGVTLTVDLARSDLMLETEMQRFAEVVDRSGQNGRRQYRLTPASLAVGRQAGLTAVALETWFVQRTGGPMTPAARLLLTGPQQAAEARPLLVVEVGTEEAADGLLQWPATRGLIARRLGPTALSVAEEDWPALEARLGELGVAVRRTG